MEGSNKRSGARARVLTLTLGLLLSALSLCTGGLVRVACYGYWHNGGGSGNCTHHLPVRLLSRRLGFSVVSVTPEDSPDLLFVSVFGNLNQPKQPLQPTEPVRIL